MKTRNGFVSNSSSSSFVVVVKDYLNEKKIFVTQKEIKLLEKFGFKRVSCFYSDQVDIEEICDNKTCASKICPSKKKQKNDKHKINYGYSVSCNQDDVLYFLLKNNIPFEATIHYGHETVIYRRNAKYFLRVQNYGKQVAMGWYDEGRDFEKNIKRSLDYNGKALERINVKKWLKEQEKWQEEYKRSVGEDIKKLGEKK